nr:hypothetical protein [uncultured Duganella sp.]
MQTNTSKRERECCTDAPCNAGLRNQYFEGKRLTVDSFRVEQDYTIERRRLLNRAIHGWGVVFGYPIRSEPVPADRSGKTSGRLLIGSGLALDPCGRELLTTRQNPLEVADATLFDREGKHIDRPPEGSYQPGTGERQQDNAPPAYWLLSVHYAEQLAGPVKVVDPCICERKEWDRVCETVRYSLRQVERAACCAGVPCALARDCATGSCSGGQREEGTLPRGDSRYLCEHLAGLSDADCGELRQLDDPCTHIRADLCHGVPLACVSLREGRCEGTWEFGHWLDACGPRRLVKSNDVLFDLVRGCDLTRINAIGWEDWHRSATLVDAGAFEESFGALSREELDHMHTNRDPRIRFPVETLQYWVAFSRLVRGETVRSGCFSITVLWSESEGGWKKSYRVPILDVKTSASASAPAGMVDHATVVVDGRWLYDAIKGTETIFDVRPITVEIEIRGDLIVDCNGQTVDANNHGWLPPPSGNGTPGGTFFSSFQVQARSASNRAAGDGTERLDGGKS